MNFSVGTAVGADPLLRTKDIAGGPCYALVKLSAHIPEPFEIGAAYAMTTSATAHGGTLDIEAQEDPSW
ncbi:hypothetical protein ColTof4_07121 [Colletotrichum tofieldiae]|nr:hypothetical protein ColTof3_12063 [Colletotrichum tofieldiae]GKT74698.1 hypothetical protein ColTof4_07121 [Colletotrichum tofieldiae]GKT91885.1 hypothetical protein Ct61P_09735 [Colletotrichum tofieldiae]